MKILKYNLLLLCLALLCACHDEDKLTPSGETLFPADEPSALSDALREMFAPYNTRIQYRYVRNFIPDTWYYITPVKEELVMPVAESFLELWIKPLVAGSSEEFVRKYFPRMLVLVGSPALQLDGTQVLGEAEGGTLIRFTDINSYSTSRSWVIEQLSTAYHEYAHILHQTFILPDKFREVTPESYTKNGWTVISGNDAVKKGMVTPYATSSVQEDFAELFAKYILLEDDLVQYWEKEIIFVPDVTGKTEEEILAIREEAAQWNAGCGLIRKKFKILSEFCESFGMDIRGVRKDFQAKLALLPEE